MVRAVLDTVVFIRCLLNPASRWGTLVFDHRDRYRLIVSEPVVEEIVEVLDRPVLAQKFRFVVGRNTEAVLAVLAEAEVARIGDVPPISRDPKDDKFIATARAARADYLVSEDADLLVLREYEGTRIVNAATFLHLLEALPVGLGRE